MSKILLITIGMCLALTFTAVDANAQDAWGSLKGKIVVEGDIPAISLEVIDRDQATCLAGKSAPQDDKLIVGKNNELKNAFVMLYLKSGDAKPAVHPSYDELKKQPVVVDNVECRFVPHAAFVRTGQSLQLKNSDDVGHNCHIVTFQNEQNVTLAKDGMVEVTLDKADKTPGNIVCDIHKWMDGVLLVRDEPYVAITKADGTFEIKNIPAGKWKFNFWHKKTGYMKKLDVPGYKVGKRKGEIEVEIKDGETLDLGTLAFPVKSIKK